MARKGLSALFSVIIILVTFVVLYAFGVMAPVESASLVDLAVGFWALFGLDLVVIGLPVEFVAPLTFTMVVAIIVLLYNWLM